MKLIERKKPKNKKIYEFDAQKAFEFAKSENNRIRKYYSAK